MSTLTKEWLQKTIAELEEERDATPGAVNEDAAMALAAMKLALASLEAEAVPEWTNEQCLEFLSIAFRHAEINGDLELDDIRLGVKMVSGSRAAMLQGAEQPQNAQQNIPENIPATQFKPVADLYGLTSPTGGETSFTFDAVEARDFIDGGWSCQEYVELGRFQEAMLQGAENAESPTTMKTAPALDSSPKIAESPSGNYPVIQEGWVACSERMPHIGVPVITCCGDVVQYAAYAWDGKEWQDWYEEYDKLPASTFTHWHPRPAAPQQEVK
ncbi:TPA: DUF551 domain-containing protein [Enterobacter hormaechei subsp. steigerwaltii]|nr:DUF551 domain-containing protein [Enterobacter hormaechei subsp. steigerwaltii]HAV1586204.1 DUF551 domain-containing protein [Enterobacter hormaechei subsp. steigerwaltii]